MLTIFWRSSIAFTAFNILRTLKKYIYLIWDFACAYTGSGSNMDYIPRVHICSIACGCSSKYLLEVYIYFVEHNLIFSLIFPKHAKNYLVFCSQLWVSIQIFSIEKSTRNKCYVLGARELSITWATNPLYWTWTTLPGSRFALYTSQSPIWTLLVSSFLIMIWWQILWIIIRSSSRANKLSNIVRLPMIAIWT